MPNIAATTEYTDRQTVPELRNSSSCHKEQNKFDQIHRHNVDGIVLARII